MATKRMSLVRRVLIAACVLVGLGLIGLFWLWARGGGTPIVSVDYVAKLNEAAVSVPEGDRGWPVYLEAIALLPISEESTALLELIDDASPGDEKWPGCVEALDTHAEAIALIREAAGKPATGIVLGSVLQPEYTAAKGWPEETEDPAGPEPAWVIDVLLPQLGDFRNMTRLLRVDALRAAEIGDAARVAADIEAMAGLGRHAREHPIVISHLVAHAIGTLTSRTVHEIIRGSPGALDDESLVRIDAAIASAFTGDRTALDLTGERYFFLDTIQRLYTDDGHGDGRVTASGLAALTDRQLVSTDLGIPAGRVAVGFMSLFSMGRAELTAEVNQMYDEIEAYAATPMWERGSAAHEAELAMTYADRSPLDIGEMMISMLMPALSKAALVTDQARAEADAARLHAALERHRLAAGRWPSSLDELAPHMLPSPPLDPYTGDPLRYVLTDAGPLIYSVGVDREDDGGRHSENASAWRGADQVQHALTQDPEGFGGDWVLEPEATADDD